MIPKQKIKIVHRLNLIEQKIEEEGIYKTHPLQHYFLDVNEKGTEIDLLWRTCSIQKRKSKDVVTKSDKNEQKHIGEYWYEIRITIPYHGFRKIESNVDTYFKSLKNLKRGINIKFVEYGFLEQYKVKAK